MSRYKFQFETGHIYDGSIEVGVNDFIGEVEGKVNPSLALTIEAHGGQLVPDKPPAKKSEAKKRKVNPVKRSADEAGEK
jgi:hypothetical protein